MNFNLKFNLKSIFIVLFLLNCNLAYSSKIYILSGGDCVGKTTTIDVLKDQGFAILPEAFTYICLEAEQQNRLQEFWSDLLAVNLKLIQTHQAWFEKIDHTCTTFSDRSALEAWFLGDFYNTPLTPELIAQVQQHKYAKVVFFLDQLPEHYFENNVARTSDRIDRVKSLQMHQLLVVRLKLARAFVRA